MNELSEQYTPSKRVAQAGVIILGMIIGTVIAVFIGLATGWIAIIC
jgi:hypothetical protein